MAHLIIQVKLTGEADDKFRFYPFMSGINYGGDRYGNIYLVPTVKITMPLLRTLAKKVGIDASTNRSLARLFLSPRYAEQMLDTFPKSSLENRDQTIADNIKLILFLFLSKGTSLQIDRRSFVIENLEWDGAFTSGKRKVIRTAGKFDVLYKVNVSVAVVAADGAKSTVRKMNVNCQTRRKQLRKALLDTFKYDIGPSKRNLTIKKRSTPQMFSTGSYKLRKPYTRREVTPNMTITPNMMSPFTMFRTPTGTSYVPSMQISPGLNYTPSTLPSTRSTLAQRGKWKL